MGLPVHADRLSGLSLKGWGPDPLILGLCPLAEGGSAGVNSPALLVSAPVRGQGRALVSGSPGRNEEG